MQKFTKHTIFIFFFYALQDTVIYSGKNNELEVSLDGYESGNNLNIYCESGSSCTIDCEGDACSSTSTILYCYNNTQTSCDTDCNCNDQTLCATIIYYNNTQQSINMENKINLLKKERKELKRHNNKLIKSKNNLNNFNLKKYNHHLKYNGKPVSYATLNYYKNNINGIFWTQDHFTMLFGVIIGIIICICVYLLRYFYQKGKKMSNFEEYQPLIAN